MSTIQKNAREKQQPEPCSVKAAPVQQPKRRRRPYDGKALLAEYNARRFVEKHGRPPTQRELMDIVGGGSKRDITKALAAFRPPSPSAIRIASLQAELDAVRISLLQAEAERDEARVAALLPPRGTATYREQQRDIDAVREMLCQAEVTRDHAIAELRANKEEIEGLRQHLLLETSRIRDEIRNPRALPPLPGLKFIRRNSTQVQPLDVDEEEPIYER